MIEACEKSMPRSRWFPKAVPWWSREIQVARREDFAARKSLQRAKSLSDEFIQRHQLIYCSKRNRLTALIRKAKKESWKAIVVLEGNKNPWSIVYKLTMAKFKKSPLFSSIDIGGSETRTWE